MARFSSNSLLRDRIRVFISSRMEELAEERAAVKSALENLVIDGWVFEKDAGARSNSIQDTFLDELARSHIYLGIFWKGYGKHTIEEFRHAKNLGLDCLIYEKRTGIEGTRDPELQEFLDQISDVTDGITPYFFNTVEELTAQIKTDIQKWQARKINIAEPAEADVREKRFIRNAIEQVKKDWIQGVQQASLHHEVRLELGLQHADPALENPWKHVVEIAGADPNTLSQGTEIDRVFYEANRTLLVLGEAGSGKTSMALDLVQHLIAEAETDLTKPFPVVFTLASWSPQAGGLREWLVQEMAFRYSFPEKKSQKWLDDYRIILVLDGLDEVAQPLRASCVEAINDYLEHAASAGIVVTCRTDAYQEIEVRLRFRGAIQIQPLAPEYVFKRIEAAGGKLDSLGSVLQQEPQIMDLARSPLMLDVMSLAFADAPGEATALTTYTTREARLQHLFETYVTRMFARKGDRADRYEPAHVHQLLGWLAHQMTLHQERLFQMERVQPSWLSVPSLRWVYFLCSRTFGGLALGFFAGIVAMMGFQAFFDGSGAVDALFALLWVGACAGGFAAGLDAWRLSHPALRRRLEAVVYVLVFASIGGLVAGLIDGIASVPLGALFVGPIGLLFGLRSRNRAITLDIISLEEIGWSTSQMLRQARHGGLWGGAVGGIVVLLWVLYRMVAGAPFDWVIGGILTVVGILGLGVLGAILAGLFGGIEKSVPEKTSFNQGMRQTLRNILVMGSLTFIVSGIVIGLISQWAVGLIMGAGAGMIAAMWYGGLDMLQHAVLRLLLLRDSGFPLRSLAFLEHARQLVLLKRVGGAFSFVHSFLLEQFAYDFRGQDHSDHAANNALRSKVNEARLATSRTLPTKG